MTGRKPRPRRAIPAVFLRLGVAFSGVGVSGTNAAFLWVGLGFLLIAVGLALKQHRERQK